jgi:hypothetical protein
MPTILCLFVLFAVASFAGEKELVLAERMREEYRREEKAIHLPEVQAYVQQLGGSMGEVRFELVYLKAEDPIVLPTQWVLVPVRALLVAKDEAEFARVLGHAVGHVVLRHGHQTLRGGATMFWPNVHPDPLRKVPTPVGFRKRQEQFEEEAEKYGADVASRAVLPGKLEVMKAAVRAALR